MSIDIKSRIPALHAELKRMQSKISELQERQKQHPEDELQIRSELDMLNERQLEVMDVMVEIQEYILGKYETLLALKKEQKSLLGTKTSLERDWVTCKSVWLRINSCESKQEELSIYNTSQLCSKLLDFSI